MGRRKYCSYQPYLDYIGVSMRERKEWGKIKEMECIGCHKSFDASLLKNRCKVIVQSRTGKISHSYIPETWDICPDCRKK